MKKIIVIGAGFSGMTAAYYLHKAGCQIDIFEKSPKPGGLIDTIKTPWGLCETAANGILNSVAFEEMSKDISLPLQRASRQSRRRYIYRGKPRQWPLTFLESLGFLGRLPFILKSPPKSFETVSDWGNRVLGKAASSYILFPALQGIYAGDPKDLSATLLLGRFFSPKKKVPKPSMPGLVSPIGGMAVFFEKMYQYLESHGVKFYFQQGPPIDSSSSPTYVIASSADSLRGFSFTEISRLQEKFKNIQMLPMARVTLFFSEKTKPGIEGFGILFPRDQGFRSLGVLFNEQIFERTGRSETFIFGGALDQSIKDVGDSALLELAKKDRERIYSESPEPVGFHISRWDRALPHYSIELERALQEVKEDIRLLEEKRIFIVGNYLGAIGLSRLLENSQTLPARILKNG